MSAASRIIYKVWLEEVAGQDSAVYACLGLCTSLNKLPEECSDRALAF